MYFRTFSTVFSYNHAMVKRLAPIAAARDVILHTHLAPKRGGWSQSAGNNWCGLHTLQLRLKEPLSRPKK